LVEVQSVKCVHYWKLPRPNGPISIGRCKKCKETKSFNNSLYNTSGWEQGLHGRPKNTKSALEESDKLEDDGDC